MWRKLIFTVLGLTTVAGCGMPPKGTEILVDTAPPGPTSSARSFRRGET